MKMPSTKRRPHPAIGRTVSFEAVGFAPGLGWDQCENLLKLLGKARVPNPDRTAGWVERCFVSGRITGRVVDVVTRDDELCYVVRGAKGTVTVPMEAVRRAA